MIWWHICTAENLVDLPINMADKIAESKFDELTHSFRQGCNVSAKFLERLKYDLLKIWIKIS